MTPAIALAAVVTFSLVLGSMIMQVDGAKLRRWRLSRRWDVSRLASEFIAAADEPLATLRGLKHMINAWERGDRRPSERYWLLYLQVFPECVNEDMAIAEQDVPADRPSDPQDIRTLAATVTALEQRIAGLSKRIDELSGDGHGERKPRERNVRRKTKVRYRPATWTPLYF